MAWTGGPKGQARVQMNKEALKEARERAEVSQWFRDMLTVGRKWEARHRKRR